MKYLLILANLYLALVAANQLADRPSNSQSQVEGEKDLEIQHAVKAIMHQVESEIKNRKLTTLSKRYYYGSHPDPYRMLMQQYYHRAYAIVQKACYKKPTIYKRSDDSKNDPEVKEVQTELSSAWQNLIENPNSLSRRNHLSVASSVESMGANVITYTKSVHKLDADAKSFVNSAKGNFKSVVNSAKGHIKQDIYDLRPSHDLNDDLSVDLRDDLSEVSDITANSESVKGAANRGLKGAAESAGKKLLDNLKPIAIFIGVSVIIYTIVQTILSKKRGATDYLFRDLDRIPPEELQHPNEQRWWGR
jgi:hypothetical protein